MIVAILPEIMVAGKFLLITNLTLFFMYLFISSLYMFRASQAYQAVTYTD